MQKINIDDPLAVWVSKVGGINPHYAHGMRHGEIRRITEARRGLPPGAINKNAPLTLEEIAQRAYETGYTASIEIDSFLDALEQDVAAKCNNQPARRVYTWESPRRYKAQEEAYMAAARQTIETTAVTIKPGAPGTRTILDAEALLRAEIAQLQAENAQLKENRRQRITLKVSEKGGVSMYGIRRFPVTFYKDEWARILDQRDNVVQFMVDHDSELKTK